MALHIVIDGYNLIRQSRQFSDLDRLDLQMGRDALIAALAAYKKVKPHPITVVFDGHAADMGMPRRDQVKGIRVRYSRPGELADTVIKRMAAREKAGALVVTSDSDVMHHAQACGAAVVSAPAFEERLMMAGYMEMKGVDDASDHSGWRPSTKKKGPSRRPSKRKRRMQKKISKL